MEKKVWKNIALSLIIINTAIITSIILEVNSAHAGSYYPKLDLIFVHHSDTNWMYQTLKHEYGHHHYYTQLNQTEREEWNNISAETNYYVSKYAMTNPREDYAETFEKVVRCEGYPQILRGHNNKKYEFFRKIKPKIDSSIAEEQLIIWQSKNQEVE